MLYRKIAAALAVTLALTVALFVVPVAGSRPAQTASAHTVPAASICAAFFDGRRSFVTVINGHLNYYVAHSRTGTYTYRVTYAAKNLVIPYTSIHLHTVGCTAP